MWDGMDSIYLIPDKINEGSCEHGNELPIKENSWISDQLPASQEELISMELNT
jgi:hypothetical protein